MKSLFSFVGITVLAIVAAVALMFGGFELKKLFAVKNEQLRRDVMVNSRAFEESTNRDVMNLKLQYIQATSDDEKAAIRALAIHQYGSMPAGTIKPELEAWLTQLMEQ